MIAEKVNIIKEPDWKSPVLNRWLGGIVRYGTRAVYMSAFRIFLEYTKLTPEQLIEEALEDAKRDPREKTDIVKQRLIGFYNWLTTEAPNRLTGGKGLSSKLGHTYVNAVRSFYDTFGVVVKLKGRSALPKPRVANKRMRLTNMDVKRLVDHCRSPRDRAIILTMFQSGMDVSTLCDLKYGDVTDGLMKNEHPLRLNLYRPKTGVQYFTFLGRDACEAIRAYLNDLKAKGITLSPNDPLFLKEGTKALTKEGITPDLVQLLMRELAIKTGFVDKNMNGRAINPLSPHALRESFGSIMTGKGVPRTVVDFWLGHEIGEMAEAYQEAQFEDVKRMYLEREPFISINTGGELEEKLRREIDEKNRQLQSLVNGLTAENLELKQRMQKLEGALIAIQQEIQNFKYNFSTQQT
ncbi:MAG: tyrosine-type recombinase/integrase [Candidatus Methanomethyliales bacterium]|nr:tyrosine-type recombinase/integrase [Candidatus Methanomethylicales archaeon]